MAHLTSRSAYRNLVERLNRFPQGAPPSQLLDKILQLLFTEKEAQLVALLPIKPFRAAAAARLWKMPLAESRAILDRLADKGIVLDVDKNGEPIYTLPPPMAGFFEFSMMRVRTDVDQKVLAELFYQYLNVEEEFIKALFTDGQTQLGRTFVHEPALPPEISLHVLEYERASEVIRSARFRAVGVCYCRHKMQHLGKACSAPLDICLTFNGPAESLIKHNVARAIDVQEGLDLLQQAYDHKLVQFGENVRESVGFICNCCGCCCEAMLAAKRFGALHPVHTTNYIPEIVESTCTGCGKCVEVCPVEAMALVSAGDPLRKKKKKARLEEEICLGCGVCVRACPEESLQLKARVSRVITPLNSTHRAVIMAVERGKLQNLIFDQGALQSHRAMAAILGVLLKAPPIKQAMASEQIKSRYFEWLVSRRKN
ncbi:MAG TPA: 4Fe-4S dicluster domain-containing protein [bacterium]|nr:4Fe-4S dicluster domain-containing protein [bacterium]HQI48942.1 4Fe-4S dicluster domain-containing protein [bacterium]HQJ64129.1 4Fe-4S dicluster domain-containing protein [bacterium]